MIRQCILPSPLECHISSASQLCTPHTQESPWLVLHAPTCNCCDCCNLFTPRSGSGATQLLLMPYLLSPNFPITAHVVTVPRNLNPPNRRKWHLLNPNQRPQIRIVGNYNLKITTVLSSFSFAALSSKEATHSRALDKTLNITAVFIIAKYSVEDFFIHYFDLEKPHTTTAWK